MAMTQHTATCEQRIVLYDVSWETYESLLTNYEDKSSPRFTYDRGVLEIVSPTFQHEKINRALAEIVATVADELDIAMEEAGSTTFKRQGLQRGFEADSSFYIRHATNIAGKTTIDLNVDPPPDLVIEIELTNSSLDKLPLFAEMGVPEIWRYSQTNERVAILHLDGHTYRDRAQSIALPPLTAHVLTAWIKERFTLGRPAWKRRVHSWLRDHA